MTPKQAQAMQELAELGQEMDCGSGEPHEIESFPGDRWGRGRCIKCGYEPFTQPEDFE